MLRNPDPMPSACYLPSHPPGKPRARQAHCAQMLPRRQDGRLCRALVGGGECRGYDLATLGYGFKLFQGKQWLLCSHFQVQVYNCRADGGSCTQQACAEPTLSVDVRTLRSDICLPGPQSGGAGECRYRKQMVKVVPRLREEVSGSVGSGALWILGIDWGVSEGGTCHLVIVPGVNVPERSQRSQSV